jgi:hypothetical protein
VAFIFVGLLLLTTSTTGAVILLLIGAICVAGYVGERPAMVKEYRKAMSPLGAVVRLHALWRGVRAAGALAFVARGTPVGCQFGAAESGISAVRERRNAQRSERKGVRVSDFGGPPGCLESV